jgi:hypothetical protein
MLVVLIAAGDVIGTPPPRMGGRQSARSQDEFELVSCSPRHRSRSRNADAHGAVMTQAEHDALTGLRNHGAFSASSGC